VPVETQFLADFSGGEQDAISSLEFEESEWMMLRGFVFDNSRRLRSQWAVAEWDVQLAES
jgi:hypothetical protein